MTEDENVKTLKSFENSYQNAITQAANEGVFSFAPTSISEVTQINSGKLQIKDHLDEEKEALNEINRPEER